MRARRRRSPPRAAFAASALLVLLLTVACGDEDSGETVDGDLRGETGTACVDPKPLPASFPQELPVPPSGCVRGVSDPLQPGYYPWRVEVDLFGVGFEEAVAYFERAWAASGLQIAVQADQRSGANAAVQWCVRGPTFEGTVAVFKQLAYRGSDVGVVYVYPTENCV